MRKESEAKKWEEANRLVDLGMEYARRSCAPYSFDELLKMIQEGKNPLLGDKP